MKKLAIPLALVLVSLMSVALFTTMTAMTLVSYSKSEKSGIVEKQIDSETVKR